MDLTEQQLRFCQEYAADPNATQAYRRAFPGCTYHTARVEGSRLLANPAIAAEMKAARKEYARRVRIDATRVLRGLAEVAFADPIDVYRPDPTNGGLPSPRPWSEVPAAARRAIQSVKVKRRRLVADKEGTEWEIEEMEFRFYNRMDALDKLSKHLGLTDDGNAVSELLALLRGPAGSEAHSPGDATGGSEGGGGTAGDSRPGAE